MDEIERRVKEECEALLRGERTPEQVGVRLADINPCDLSEYYQGYLGKEFLPEEEFENDQEGQVENDS